LKMTLDERRTVLRVRKVLAALEPHEALAILHARSLRPTIRTHAQKTALHKIDRAIREAVAGRPL